MTRELMTLINYELSSFWEYQMCRPSLFIKLFQLKLIKS